MALFAVPKRAGRELDKAIAGKAKTKRSMPATVKGGGLLAQINQIKATVEKNLGQFRKDYEIITTKERLKEFIDICISNDMISIDTETTGLDPILDKIVGLCLYTPNEKAVYVPINHISYITGVRVENQLTEKDVADVLKDIVTMNTFVVMFNAKFDIRVIRNQLGVYLDCDWDCYLAAKLMNENEPSHGLKQLHKKYVLDGVGDAFSFDALFKGLSFDKIPINTGYLYAAHDAIITYELYEYQQQYLHYEHTQPHEARNGMNGVSWVFFNIEMPCLKVVCDMEDMGVAFDFEYQKQLSDKYNALLEEKQNEFYKVCDMYSDEIEEYRKQAGINCKLDNPVNVGSPSQIAILLYDIIGVKNDDVKSPRGTGEAILQKINNPIAKDRLRYDVFFHSDLSRKGGKTNGQDLSYINWGNYDLVVIDESHNFRNGGKVTTDENDDNPRENRYLQLMNRVIRSGVKTKVLMLSATPVNNRFNDLKNQIQLAYEGESEKIDELLNTSSSIDDIFRQAQKEYNIWAKLPAEERTTKELLNRLSFDFFEVLDSVTIARSRKHIEQYYDTADIGKFPTRLTPIPRRPDLTDLDSAINYNEIYEIVSRLNLAIYTPSDFILASRVEKYIDTDNDGGYFAGRGMAGREKGIRRLMSINLLKRLESSVNSFRLTLERIKNLISSTIDKLATIEQGENFELELEDISQNLDYDDREADMFIGGKKTKIALQDLDHIAWRRYLEEDMENLNLLLLMLADITPEHDSKLQQLVADLRYKFANPINEGNKKVIIFTAFSDTAEYLYDCLAEPIKAKHGLHTALVSGDVEARSTLRLPQREKLDFNKVLTLFSPISKEKGTIYPHIQDEIDVLIATDCISEGQNLQDCDYLINYDIHWNPVRIIQRFGRIDRIGSRNKVIQLVNYWPNVTLDEYIDLKGRVEARMKVSVLTSTGDDNPISPEEKGDLEYRREQLKRLQSEVVDIEEMNTGISIMDLGLNEFRMDLLAYLKEHPNIEHTPFGLHAVVPAREDSPSGVVYVLKNRNNGVNIDHKNRLHPFYMVYISDDKEVIVNHLSPKELLDRLRFLCKGKDTPDMDICREFNRITRDGKNMQHYSELLGDAIASIINVKEESDIDSFLSGVQGSLFTEEIRGLDDFELICFLVIK